MSVVYCEHHDTFIDTDYNAEHFLDDGECFDKALYALVEEGYTEELALEKLEDN